MYPAPYAPACRSRGFLTLNSQPLPPVPLAARDLPRPVPGPGPPAKLPPRPRPQRSGEDMSPVFSSVFSSTPWEGLLQSSGFSSLTWSRYGPEDKVTTSSRGSTPSTTAMQSGLRRARGPDQPGHTSIKSLGFAVRPG